MVFTVVLAAGVLREISTPVQLGGGGLLLVGVLVALRPTVAVVPPAPEGGPVAETEQLLR